MKALIVLMLLFFWHNVSSVIHSLQYFCTASSGVPSFPKFVAVAMVDGVQIGCFDSNKRAVLKQAWSDQITTKYPDYMEGEIRLAFRAEQLYKARIEIMKNRFNQTGGAHTYQSMSGCEWDDEDGSTEGFLQIGYDGEDFLVLDMKTRTWIAPIPQAVTTKLIWDHDRVMTAFWKKHYSKDCVDWLKKFLAYGKSTQKTERPQVSLLQRTPSSPVECHATGFYTDRVVVFWTRDGQEVYEGVEQWKVLPNHDGTFQVSVDLDLTSVPKEDCGRYQCVVQLEGMEDISTPLDPARIRTNWVKTGLERNGEPQSDITTPIIGCVVLLLAAVVAAFGFLLYKRRNGSDTSSETVDGQNPAPEDQPLTTHGNSFVESHK